MAVFYRGRRGPPYTVGHAEPFGSSRYESNLYIVKPSPRSRTNSIHLVYTTGIQCHLLVGLSLAAYIIAIKLMVLNASNVDVAHMTFGQKKIHTLT